MENILQIETRFGTAKVERIMDGFFVAFIGDARATEKTAAAAAAAAARVAQNIQLVEMEKF